MYCIDFFNSVVDGGQAEIHYVEENEVYFSVVCVEADTDMSVFIR